MSKKSSAPAAAPAAPAKQTVASAPPPASTVEATATGPEVDAAVADLFGKAPSVDVDTAADGTVVDPDTGTPPIPASAPEPAAPAQDDGEGDDEPDPTQRLDLAALRKAAEDREKKREAKGGTETKLRDLEQKFASLETQAASDKADAAKFRELQKLSRDDALAIVEALGHDPVAFVQSAHRQALDRDGHKTAQTVEQISTKLEAALARIAELESGTPKLLEQRDRDAQAARNRQELVAVTEDAEKYRFAAARSAEERLKRAPEAVQLLVDAGIDVGQINHQMVAQVLDNLWKTEFERTAATLGLQLPAGTPSTSTESGGGSAANGRTRAGAAKPPRTITQQLAAEPSAERELTERERDLQATRILSELFGRSTG